MGLPDPQPTNIKLQLKALLGGRTSPSTDEYLNRPLIDVFTAFCGWPRLLSNARELPEHRDGSLRVVSRAEAEVKASPTDTEHTMVQLLRISPEEVIEFPLVLYTPLNANLKLENISEESVAFKIKTTAPKGYLVRPSTGIIRAGEQQSIQIILQPLSEAPKSVNDRFLVQSVPFANEEPVPKDLWSTVDKAQVCEHRLSVSLVKDPGLNIQSGNSPHGIPPRIAARLFTPQSANVDLPELRQKYDELVQYCLSVEKLKGQIIKENEQLRQRLNLAPTDSLGTRLSFELWYIPIIVMVMAIVAKYMGHI